MSRRRSLRQSSSASSSTSTSTLISPSIKEGLNSLIKGNESYISKLLSLGTNNANSNIETIYDALVQCMAMNHISAEMLLARFFDESILSIYAERVLHKSGKGSALTLAARIAKEWQSVTSKRKRESVLEDDCNESTHTKKNRNESDLSIAKVQEGAEEQEDENDWKLPLFFWKGTLEQHTTKTKTSPLVWKGSWVSGLSKDGLPSLDDYKATKEGNSFSVSGKLSTSAKKAKEVDQGNCLETFLGQRGQFNKGGYLLDQGDDRGSTTFKDISHRFVFDSSIDHQKDMSVVFASASGKTEFGNFVSFGYVHSKCTIIHSPEESGVIELILARRYIDDDDSRQALVAQKRPDFISNTSLCDVSNESFWTHALPRR